MPDKKLYGGASIREWVWIAISGLPMFGFLGWCVWQAKKGISGTSPGMIRSPLGWDKVYYEYAQVARTRLIDFGPEPMRVIILRWTFIIIFMACLTFIAVEIYRERRAN